MAKLTSMKNIGAELEKKLTAVGIDSSEKLKAEGAEASFLKLKTLYPNICLVHLYALEGAIQNLDIHGIPLETKQKLKAFSGALRGKGGSAF